MNKWCISKNSFTLKFFFAELIFFLEKLQTLNIVLILFAVNHVIDDSNISEMILAVLAHC